MENEPDRPPLDAESLRTALPGRYAALEVVEATGSTNADLVAAARAGAADRTVLVAESQTAGRGRAGRHWLSAPRAGLAVSVLLRPGPMPLARLGWLPLLAGVALADVVGRLGRIEAGLKWPNDLLVAPRGRTEADDGAGGAEVGGGSAGGGGHGYRKAAGILADLVPGVTDQAVVIGVGLNVSTGLAELPRAAGDGAVPPTSLGLAGSACTDRAELLRAFLVELDEREAQWRAAEGDPDTCGLRERYLHRCDTVGRRVRVLLPGDTVLTGTAIGIDADGRLLVRPADGDAPGTADGDPRSGRPVAVSAGDVVHVRPAAPAR